MSTELRATQYDSFANQILTVTSNEELTAALAKLTTEAGGTIRLDESGGPYKINLIHTGSEDTPVLITSANPETPAVVSDLTVFGGSHLTVSNVMFENGAAGDGLDVSIMRSSHIEVIDSTARGIADGFLSEEGTATQGGGFALIRSSDNVKLLNNDVHGYDHAIGVLDNTGLVVAGNEISGVQGDGLRGGGLSDSIIANNYMHSFYGSTQTLNHSDMIQLWGYATQTANKNIEISGNILDTQGAAATQGIFIRNEMIGRDGPQGEYFDNISITNNVIHNGHWHGISVSNTTNLELSSNTVLWDKSAATKSHAASEATSAAPHIMVSDTPDARVYDNIAHKFVVVDPSLSPDDVRAQNTVIDYTDRGNDMYVEKVIVNYDNMGAHDPRDFLVRTDSGVSGDMGADIRSMLPQDAAILPVIGVNEHEHDHMVLRFSAEDTLLDDGISSDEYDISWHFEDGTVLQGSVVHKRFDDPGTQNATLRIVDGDGEIHSLTRGFGIADPELFTTGFEATPEDQSSYESRVLLHDIEGNALSQDGTTGQGFYLNGGNEFQIAAENGQLQNMDRFEIDFDLRMMSDVEAGRMLYQHGVMDLQVLANGSLHFTLKTDAGGFVVASESGAMHTDAWQHVSIRYDAAGDGLSLIIDDEVVGQNAEATGATVQSAHAMVLGAPWSRAPNAVFDNLAINKQASEAFELELDPEQPAAEDPEQPDQPDQPEVVTLFDTGFEGTAEDLSEFGSTALVYSVDDTGLTDEGLDGQGFFLTKGNEYVISAANEHLQELEQFEIAFDLRMLSDGEYGRMMYQHQVMELKTMGDGRLNLTLRTDVGDFQVTTAKGTMQTDDWQHISIRYDGAGEGLSLSIDGEVLASNADATGTTMDTPHAMVLGAPWVRSPDAIFDNFSITREVIPDDSATGPFVSPEHSEGFQSALVLGMVGAAYGADSSSPQSMDNMDADLSELVLAMVGSGQGSVSSSYVEEEMDMDAVLTLTAGAGGSADHPPAHFSDFDDPADDAYEAEPLMADDLWL